MKISVKSLFIFIFIFQLLAPSVFAAKENSSTLTIIPPIMKDNMAQGDVKSSAIKIVNNNSVDIEVYTRVLDFKGKDGGGVEFIEDIDAYSNTGLEKYFLSGWVMIEEGPIKIGANKSKNIPFLIEVPEDASPGGHYAAILVGTKPTGGGDGTVVKISSYISSLMLIKIAGDVQEKGLIREFTTDKSFYKDNLVNFKVRFENLGNIHLQPRGEIKVYNILGKEKLSISINDSGNFGNVLPGDVRDWNLSWQTDNEVLLFDRFKAELNLSYGDEVKASDFREIYFWAINFKAVAVVVGVFLFVILFLIFVVKFYINQSVKNMKRQFGIEEVVAQKQEVENKKVKTVKKNRVVDLRNKK